MQHFVFFHYAVFTSHKAVAELQRQSLATTPPTIYTLCYSAYDSLQKLIHAFHTSLTSPLIDRVERTIITITHKGTGP